MRMNTNKCHCGCGGNAGIGKRFVSGHNLKTLKRTSVHCERIAQGQARAWKTKRKRMPIGSKNTDSHGYTRVKVLAGAGRWNKEHVMVVEQSIGRHLKRGECVHHINGVRNDNRLENLFLCRSPSHHSLVDQSVKRLLKTLVERGIIWFNREEGGYELSR
jgi:hypothetical protein